MTHVPLRFRGLWRAVGALLCVLVVYLSLKSDPIELPLGDGDRFGHMLAYAVLMYWFTQLNVAGRIRFAWAVGFIAMGIALEFLQRLTETRSFSRLDMLANACGVGLGWLAAPPRSPHLLPYFEAWWFRHVRSRTP